MTPFINISVNLKFPVPPAIPNNILDALANIFICPDAFAPKFNVPVADPMLTPIVPDPTDDAKLNVVAPANAVIVVGVGKTVKELDYTSLTTRLRQLESEVRGIKHVVYEKNKKGLGASK